MLNNTPNGWRPATTKLGIVALISFCFFFAWPATAEVFKLESQWTCGETLALGKELQSAGEQIVGTGKMDGVVIMTIWVNTTTRSWTMVATPVAKPDTSCIIIHGDNFKPISPGVTV
jgi:hypothetical protein